MQELVPCRYDSQWIAISRLIPCSTGVKLGLTEIHIALRDGSCQKDLEGAARSRSSYPGPSEVVSQVYAKPISCMVAVLGNVTASGRIGLSGATVVCYLLYSHSCLRALLVLVLCPVSF